MKKTNKTKKDTAQTQKKTFRSFMAWKEYYFPALVKEEQRKKLGQDPEKLARIFVDDAFKKLQEQLHNT